MLNNKKRLKLDKTQIILLSFIAFFLVLLIISLIISNFKDASDYWSLTFSQAYFYIFGHINSIFPFSVMEVLIIFWIISLITLIVVDIIYLVKQNKTAVISVSMSVVLLLSGIFSLYYATYGPTYKRSELPFVFYDDVTKDEFKDITLYFVNDFNDVARKLNSNDEGMVLCPYTLDELSDVLIKEYEKLDNPYFYKYTPKGKSLTFSYFFTLNHIAGVSFSLTGEPNINILNVESDLGFSLAHEMAHQKGIAKEDDANVVAAYICLNSDDPYLRYSGYNRTINSLLSLLKYTDNKDDYKEVKSLLDDKIIKDNAYAYKYWQKHNLLEKVGTFFNDLYLTLFSNKGVTSYDDSWTIIDTGNKDEDGNPILDIKYSNYQKLYFDIYKKNNA